MVEPDLAGFAAAQQNLRDKLGRDVRFYTPIPPTWDPLLSSAAFDPETGEPYDPQIKPIASGFSSAMIRCSVVERPFGLSRTGVEDQMSTEAIGLLTDNSVGLIMGSAQWPAASGATEFEIDGNRFKIRDAKVDGIGAPQRQIVVGEQE